jgi:hypothetical protein
VLPLRTSGFGGLIAIGGPPFGGKGVLAAELLEWPPRAQRLETADDLERRAKRSPSAEALLARARGIWRSAHGELPPTLLLVARFPSAAQRRRVRRAALAAGMPFLFVEARSTESRARQRLLARAMTEAEARERLARYRAALAAYRPVTRAEQMLLPALRLERVQSSLDAAVARVLASWSTR